MHVDGFSYYPGFLSWDESRVLFTFLRLLPFARVSNRGTYLHRELVCYGHAYDVQRRNAHAPAPPLPPFLASLRDRAAATAGVDAAPLTDALLWKYPAGAEIGWHRDNPAYGPVICGVSLGGAARLRLQYGSESAMQVITAGSLYCLRGPARSTWEHKVDDITEERISITFRSYSASSRGDSRNWGCDSSRLRMTERQ
jgi:alkylated DNA repair protein (DNA oxidative demethylase)